MTDSLNDFSFRDEYWKRLEEKIGGEEGKSFVYGMKELYSIYDGEMVEWFARLYDPTVGGYYYSNCARDNEKIFYHGMLCDLRPDIESTEQALRFIAQSGLAGAPFKSKYTDFIPSWMKEKLRVYLKPLQDENGYFYNPQWPREFTDKKISRRARDTGRAIAILEEIGSNPTYDSMTGAKGDYLDVSGTPVSRPKATGNNGESTASGPVTYPAHLENADTFRRYLTETYDIRNKSYSVGNTLTSEMAQIIYRDKVLKESGADYSLVDILIDWLNENQYENGLWHPKADYYGVNGLMKTSGCYGKVGRLMPKADKAVRAALDAISTDEEATAVTSVYNTWFAVERVKRHLRNHGGEEGKRIADGIVKDLIATAKERLITTGEKLLPFKKPYGSFSYTPKSSAARSQGCPVAFDGIYEGDINATLICSSDILYYIYASYELIDYAVPIFGDAHRKRYLSILNEANSKA